MSDPDIEDAEWEEVPGNDGRLPMLSPPSAQAATEVWPEEEHSASPTAPDPNVWSAFSSFIGLLMQRAIFAFFLVVAMAVFTKGCT